MNKEATRRANRMLANMLKGAAMALVFVGGAILFGWFAREYMNIWQMVGTLLVLIFGGAWVMEYRQEKEFIEKQEEREAARVASGRYRPAQPD